MFEHKVAHKCTWYQNTLGRRLMIDIVIVSSDMRSYDLDTRMKRGGKLLFRRMDIARRWKEHFEELKSVQHVLWRGGIEPISLAEAAKIVKNLLGCKAPGVDEICPEMLKALDIVWLSWLHVSSASWTPPIRGLSGTSNREETPEKTQDLCEGLYLPGDLGTPRDPPEWAVKCCGWEGSLGQLLGLLPLGPNPGLSGWEWTDSLRSLLCIYSTGGELTWVQLVSVLGAPPQTNRIDCFPQRRRPAELYCIFMSLYSKLRAFSALCSYHCSYLQPHCILKSLCVNVFMQHATAWRNGQ